MCFLDKLADRQRLEVQGAYWPVLGWWLELCWVEVWIWGPHTVGGQRSFARRLVWAHGKDMFLYLHTRCMHAC